MQTGEIIVALGIALVLALIYNVYQALERRKLFNQLQAKQDLEAQINSLRHELRNVRSDLTNERQRVDVLTQQVSDAGRTRGTFLDHMGYFIRTPLNLIIGYSEMLMSGIYGKMTDVQQTRLVVIQRSGKDLLKYFTDMLDLHRLEIGSVELQLKAVEVAPLVERIVAQAEEARPRDSVALEQDIAPNIGRIMGDEKRIEQVLLHLISNAVRFTHKGSVAVRARSVKVRDGKSDGFDFPMLGWLKDGEWIVLSVNDTGIGIPSDAQASIFETFYQVARDQTEEQRGIGLGLAIAKRMIELHGGVIWVKSEEGVGSTFHVALRAFRDARASDTQEQLRLPTLRRDDVT
jgi:signal transduction histidine kinase